MSAAPAPGYFGVSGGGTGGEPGRLEPGMGSMGAGRVGGVMGIDGAVGDIGGWVEGRAGVIMSMDVLDLASLDIELAGVEAEVSMAASLAELAGALQSLPACTFGEALE